MNDSPSHRKLWGIPASPGVAIGRAFVYRKEVPSPARRRISTPQVEAEAERFLNILHQVGEEIRRTRRLVEKEHGADLAQIFEAQLAMVEDVEVKEQTLAWIRQKHYPAERAFAATLQQMKKIFENIENEYLRARLSDVIDFEYQVLVRLAGGEWKALRSLRANTVVVARDLLPSEAAQLERRLVKGLVTDLGGATSHSSILARSLRLPAVVGAGNACREIASGDVVIVDGDEGMIYVRPEQDTLRFYTGQLRRQQRRRRSLQAHSDLPARTLDGKEIALMANIDLPTEVQTALDHGACGVGMYRTEYLYLGYRLPTEEEQLQAYTQIAEALAPHSVVIRTIDLGGDKLAHVLDVDPEANPFLGWRGIRICLDTPDLFKTQLRALLRAGLRGDVHILFPMISSLEEVRRARALLEETKSELRAEGRAFAEHCKVGLMVEVPSVALMAEQFAREVDFFSLGTNDLTQYTLAVDRSTAKVAELYEPFHPAVLKQIEMVVASSEKSGIPSSICGEMAGDPLATMLLLGLGLENLSLSPVLIPEVKEVIRSIRLGDARRIAARCLEMETGTQVRRELEGAMQQYLGAHSPSTRKGPSLLRDPSRERKSGVGAQ